MGSTRSILIVAVAALCALFAALIVGKLLAHPAKPAPVAAAPVAKPMAQVLVAHRDLPIGTTLANGDLSWQAWPVEAVNPAFITDGRPPEVTPTSATATTVATNVTRAAAGVVGKGPMDGFYGAIVREPILANEPITNIKLVRGGEGGFMAVVLHPGTRAIAVPVNSGTAAGGFILPGDRVDVMQSHQEDSGAAGGSGGRTGQVAQVLLRNVRVLAIDQTTKAARNTPSVIGSVATLEVPAAFADVVVRAKAQGEIVLALRSYSDASGPTQTAQASSASGVVRIFRDGKPTEMMVSP